MDERGVHPSYQVLVSRGLAFGARRWVAALQRQCERIATLLMPLPLPPIVAPIATATAMDAG